MPRQIIDFICGLLSAGTGAVKEKFNNVVNSFLEYLLFAIFAIQVYLMIVQTFVLIGHLDVKLNFSWTNKAIGINLNYNIS